MPIVTVRVLLAGVALALTALSAGAQEEIPVGPEMMTPILDPGAGPVRQQVWAGVYHAETYTGGFVGTSAALNGENLYANGGILRAEFSAGEYDPSVFTHGGSMMFGYRTVGELGVLTGYVGVAYDTHNAPPGAELRGTEGGLRVAGEYSTPLIGDIFSVYNFASYTTVRDTFFAMMQPGVALTDNIQVGPSFQYFQNEAYEDYGVGGYAMYHWDAGAVVGAAGHREPLVSDVALNGGYYVSLTFILNLR